MDTFLQDARFAIRSLRRARGTTAVAVLCLALGIGANAAIYSVVQAVLLASLPYGHAGQLVAVAESYVARGERGVGSVAPANFLEWQRQTSIFSGVAAYVPGSRDLGDVGEPEHLRGIRITPSLFTVLEARPLLGRTILPADDQTAKLVVISEGLWRRRFGANPGLIGTAITLNGVKYTVVGVMPEQFDFPITPLRMDFWMPLDFSTIGSITNRGNHSLTVVGRLAPGVDSAQAARRLDVLAKRLQQQFPVEQHDRGIVITSLTGKAVGGLRPALMVLLGTTGLVLLIACANVASLLLARAAGRRREVAIRTALGAARGRLLRQLLTEATLLAVAGGLLGLGVAWIGLHSLLNLASAVLPRGEAIALDARVVTYAGLVSLLTGLVVGTVPALRASQTNLREDLSDAAGKSSAGVARHRTLAALITGEIALSLMLLVGAGLVIRSFVALLDVNPGFRAENVVTFHVAAPAQRIADSLRAEQFYNPLLEKARALPGVRAAGFTNVLPIQDGPTDRYFSVIGRPPSAPGQHPDAENRIISAGYFTALGIPVLAGREFLASDTRQSEPVIIINDALAKQYFADENPIGKQIEPGTGVAHRVVGVVQSVRQLGLDQPARAEFYLPATQERYNTGAMAFVLATRGDSRPVMSAIRDLVRSVDPQQPVYLLGTMQSVISSSLGTRRLLLMLLGLFAGLALVLSAAGVYGVMSYGVSQRTREIGIRMALGAHGGDVAGMIMRDTGRVVVAGIVVGLGAAVGLTGVLQSMLYGVGTHDPVTFVAVPALIVVVALVAGAVPALRVTRVDPLISMRSE
jgi:predicted permease